MTITVDATKQALDFATTATLEVNGEKHHLSAGMNRISYVVEDGSIRIIAMREVSYPYSTSYPRGFDFIADDIYCYRTLIAGLMIKLKAVKVILGTTPIHLDSMPKTKQEKTPTSRASYESASLLGLMSGLTADALRSA